MSKFKFENASKYDKSLPHQLAAWRFLDEKAPKKIKDEFVEIYRGKADVEVIKVDDAKETGERAYVAKILKYIKQLGIELDKPPAHARPEDYAVNIIGVEGINPDFSVNDDRPNSFNDLFLLLGVNKDGKFRYLLKSVGTTEPGTHYTVNAMNAAGAARVVIDTKHENIWQVGYHGRGNGRHLALVQTGNQICVTRDKNKDYARTNDRVMCGYYGINFHGGYNMPLNNIGRASAGCAVIRLMKEQAAAMKIIGTDYFYKLNKKHRFSYIVVDGGKALNATKSTSHRYNHAKADKTTEDIALQIIIKWECGGSVEKYLNAYADPAHGWSVPTIGIGTIKYPNGRKVRRGDTITKEQAYEYCLHFIRERLYPNLRRIPDWEKMTPEMQASLISFAYNLGAFYGASGFTTINRYLKEKNWSSVPSALRLYNKAGGKTLQGLVNRRADEANLWLNGLNKL